MLRKLFYSFILNFMILSDTFARGGGGGSGGGGGGDFSGGSSSSGGSGGSGDSTIALIVFAVVFPIVGIIVAL